MSKSCRLPNMVFKSPLAIKRLWAGRVDGGSCWGWAWRPPWRPLHLISAGEDAQNAGWFSQVSYLGSGCQPLFFKGWFMMIFLNFWWFMELACAHLSHGFLGNAPCLSLIVSFKWPFSWGISQPAMFDRREITCKFPSNKVNDFDLAILLKIVFLRPVMTYQMSASMISESQYKWWVKTIATYCVHNYRQSEATYSSTRL